MAIDRDAIQKKLAALQASTTRNNSLWKPEPGKNRVRIVPCTQQKDNPFLELYFYYDLGKKSYLSNYTFGESDPIVEFCEELKSTGIKEDWILGKKLEPKLRTYVPIIVRGKEKEDVKFWGFGKEIYQELLSIISDPDYGDITDLKSGRDIDVEYLTPKEAGNTYGSTKVRVKPNQTEATDDSDVLSMINDDQPDIYSIFKKKSYDELKEALERWLDPEKFSDDSTAVNANIEKARKAGGVEAPKNESSSTEKDTKWIDEEDEETSESNQEAKKPTINAEEEFDKLFKDE